MHTHKKQQVITGIITLIIGIGIGYVGSSAFKSTTIPSQNMRGAFTGTYSGTGRGGTNGGGLLTGTVVKQDTGSITLNTRDGNSHLVFITPGTSISKSVTGAASDVTVGTSIIVSGTTNSDGSVSANLIQLRPAAAPALPQAQ